MRDLREINMVFRRMLQLVTSCPSDILPLQKDYIIALLTHFSDSYGS
jgi:hypothetical protein